MIPKTSWVGTMDNMIKVVRFSNNGFKPQVQTHHLEKLVWYHLSDKWDKDFEKLTKRVNLNRAYIHEIKKIHAMRCKFYREHYNDLSEGIWVFKYGNVDKKEIEFLNGEDGKFVHKYVANLPADIIVYDSEWTRVSTLGAETILPFGCYIPKRMLMYLQNEKRLY